MNKKEREQHLTAIYNEVARQVWDEGMAVRRFAAKVWPKEVDVSEEALKQSLEQSIRDTVFQMLGAIPTFDPDRHEDAKKALDAVKDKNDKGVSHSRVFDRFHGKYWKEDFFANPHRTVEVLGGMKELWTKLDQLSVDSAEADQADRTGRDKLEYEYIKKDCAFGRRTQHITLDVAERYMRALCKPS